MAKIITICNAKGGVGKCVAPETPILLASGKLTEIENLFNEHLKRSLVKQLDEKGLFIKPADNLKVFSLDENLKLVESDVEWLYRGKTSKLYEIVSSGGKVIRVTPRHPFLISRNGEIDWVRAENVREGDFIAVPRNITLKQAPLSDISGLISEEIYVLVKNRNFIDAHLESILSYHKTDLGDVVLFNILKSGNAKATDLYKLAKKPAVFAHLQKLLRQKLIERQRMAGSREYEYSLNHNRVVDYLHKRGFSISVWKEHGWPKEIINKFVYRNASFHIAAPINPIFEIDKNLTAFIAIILAEGYFNTSRIVLYNTSKKIIEAFTSYCERLGLEYILKQKGNLWIATVNKAGTLMKILNCVFNVPVKGNRKSFRIKMSNVILEAPLDILASYLGAYLDCEGYIAKDRSIIEITSASFDNIVALQYAFLRFGINARLKSMYKSASNSPSPKRRQYHTLTISGSYYAQHLLDKLSINEKHKIERLKTVANFHYNTNIDVVPAGSLIKKIRHKFHISQSDIGVQGTVADYENGDSLPSRNAVQSVISTIQKKVAISEDSIEFKQLHTLAYSDVYWERLVSIQQVEYKDYVYDLTVSHTHNFVAGNGAFIVHNTTTAVNLSSYLAALGKRVLLIDFDPQANATSGLGIDPKSVTDNIYHGMIGYADIDKLIKKTIIYNHHLIPANQDLSGALVELVGMDEREFLLRKFINRLRHQYDYVFIDLPPSLNLLTLNGLVASDEVLIPIQCEYYSLEGLGQILEIIDLINNNLGRQIKVAGGLLTMYDKREKLSREVAREVRTHFPHKVFDTEIPRSVSLAEAPSFGKPIILHDPNSQGAKAYERLAKEIIELELRI